MKKKNVHNSSNEESSDNINWEKEKKRIYDEHGIDLDSPVELIKEHLENDFNSKLKIGFFGSPGAGKSTLMDKIIGKKVTDSGVAPGVEVKSFVWGENDSIVFTDLPGYGGLPEEHTVESFWDDYDLSSFDAFLCCFESKFNKDDEFFFKKAKERGKHLIFTRTKSDNIFDEDKTINELKQEIQEKLINDVFGSDSTLIFTSAKTNEGIDELQFAIIDNLSTKQKEKFFRNAKAYSKSFLEYKAKAAEKTTIYYSFLAAGSGAVPLPGVGALIDIPMTLKMINTIGKQFGLTPERLSKIENSNEDLLKTYETVHNLLMGTGKEAMKKFLTNLAAKEGVKNIAKFAPIVGGAAAGYGLTYFTGMKTIQECQEVAKEIIDIEINQSRN